MFFSAKLIGKILLLLSFVISINGCAPLINKPNLINNTASEALDEKPEILNISTSVKWDGNQTLGGNWISHPDVVSPERVVIKNISNGKSIFGAIFRQINKVKNGSAPISSDAALALDIAPNEQTKVQIVAVKVPESTSSNINIAEPNSLDKATLETQSSKPFIQVGIFGIQNNANKTRNQMVELNLPINIFKFQIKGKSYWRVVAGPANTPDSKAKMLKTIKSAGFTDAYYVSN